MREFTSISSLEAHLASFRTSQKSIGFVPTMGALHDGHLSLIERSGEVCDITVCSIFVNPTQFNDASDFEHYPRTIERDRKILEEAGCDVLFTPNKDEMYPEPDTHPYSFGALEKVMEGAHREGHFRGVGMIVRRLFEVVKPDQAFFGEKDYQQLLVVRQLASDFNLNLQVIGCPIVREGNGLAMSSRNRRLSTEAVGQASVIYRVLRECADRASYQSPEAVKAWAEEALANSPGLETEYIEIAEASTLEAVDTFQKGKAARAFVAAHIEGVRLIDNLEIFI